MKVKQHIIEKVNNVDSRRRICNRLETGDQSFYKLLRINANDGELTKMKYLLALSEETGIRVLEILEPARDEDAVEEIIDADNSQPK